MITNRAPLMSAKVVFALLLSAPALSQELPISDGVYLRKASSCTDLRNNELDFVDFEVTEGGRALGLPEAGCVVASVTAVRDGRSFVTADCSEFGELWEYTFFLDVRSDDEIAIDGVNHRLCDLEVPPTDFGPEWAQFVAQPDEMLCWFVAVRDTRDYWWVGDSDGEEFSDLVPTSELFVGTEIPAYRQGAVQEPPVVGPNGIPLVFAFKGYFVPLADLKFVGKCGPSR